MGWGDANPADGSELFAVPNAQASHSPKRIVASILEEKTNYGDSALN
jgi:hypothetical protein